MNANRSRTGACAVSLALAALAGCVPAPNSAPAPVHRPAPPPPLLPLSRPPIDWRDAPVTPGSWNWTREGSASIARFENGLFALRCAGRGGPVRLERSGNAGGPLAMMISTTTGSRALTATRLSEGEASVGVSLPVSDPLLDAMAFSRGRIAIEVSGMAPLYLPAWPELARVIEDCR